MSKWIPLLIILTTVISLGCIQKAPAKETQGTLILATTTSTYDSGLLDYLIPVFEERYDVKVKVISVGTGQALELGRRGDADVILVHSPEDEKRFIEQGYGTLRGCVMYNDFVIIGPEKDPAGIKNRTVTEALKAIAAGGAVFISRGDDSGTHKKERALWKIAGVEGMGEGYVETGTGMGQTLLTASEMKAYTLSDRATFVSMKEGLDLSILVSGDETLLNPYGIIAVNPKKNPEVKHLPAAKLVSWVMSEEGQGLIGSFTKNGEQLFTPLNGRCLED